MWIDSKKWKELRASGKHGVIRFDVFCGQCNKQLAENIDSDDLNKYGICVYRPMEIFCSYECAKNYQTMTGKRLWMYGWTPLFSEKTLTL